MLPWCGRQHDIKARGGQFTAFHHQFIVCYSENRKTWKHLERIFRNKLQSQIKCLHLCARSLKAGLTLYRFSWKLSGHLFTRRSNKKHVNSIHVRFSLEKWICQEKNLLKLVENLPQSKHHQHDCKSKCCGFSTIGGSQYNNFVLIYFIPYSI